MSSAAEFLPRRKTFAGLRRAAEGCRGCDLWKDATQTVFGEGPPDAELMLVGGQPGDREDLEGEPFVGPAGGVLALGATEREEALAGLVEDLRFIVEALKKPAARA